MLTTLIILTLNAQQQAVIDTIYTNLLHWDQRILLVLHELLRQLPWSSFLHVFAVKIAVVSGCLLITIGFIVKRWWRADTSPWSYVFQIGLMYGVAALVYGMNRFILKPAIGRTRPCHELTDQLVVTVQQGCELSWSMPSNHSVVFAACAGASFILKDRGLSLSLVVYAGVVGVSRLLLGVHYPADVGLGWIVGGLFGYVLMGLVARLGGGCQRLRLVLAKQGPSECE